MNAYICQINTCEHNYKRIIIIYRCQNSSRHANIQLDSLTAKVKLTYVRATTTTTLVHYGLPVRCSTCLMYEILWRIRIVRKPVSQQRLG